MTHWWPARVCIRLRVGADHPSGSCRSLRRRWQPPSYRTLRMSPSGASDVALNPGRVLDTRNDTLGDLSAPIGERQTGTTRMTGVAGVPAAGVEAVVITVTSRRGADAGVVRDGVPDTGATSGRLESEPALVRQLPLTAPAHHPA
jgi:hypothetical protein